jgi:hypothetical protein
MIDYAPTARTRIAVFLGTGSAERTLLDLADLLAAEMASSVSGLFVEDLELLQASGLPDIRELCRLTHSVRALETAELERQLGIRARAAEQALATTADRLGVPWSFRAVRGTLDALLADALREIDVLLLDLTSSMPELTVTGPPPQPTTLRRALAVVFDGSAQSQRALAYARRMAVNRRRPIMVVLATTPQQDAAYLRSEAESVLDGHPAAFRELDESTIDEILALARSERVHTLILGIESKWVNRQNIELLRERLRCPVMLVR